MRTRTKTPTADLIKNFSKLYFCYLELRFLLPKRRNQSELEKITKKLADSDFSVRLHFYRILRAGMRDYGDCELFQYANWMKERAEDYKRHILD